MDDLRTRTKPIPNRPPRQYWLDPLASALLKAMRDRLGGVHRPCGHNFRRARQRLHSEPESSSRSTAGRDVPLVWLCTEDQEIIHSVGFYEILRVAQFVSGLSGFANDYVLIDAMIFSVAIAINDANLGSWF